MNLNPQRCRQTEQFGLLETVSVMSVFELWLPILATGIATHLLSTLAWTVLPHHTPEWTKLPNEDDLYKTLENKASPGQYIFPFAEDSQTMKTEAFSRRKNSLSGMLIIWPTPTNMGKAIGLTLTSFLVIAFVVGYLASIGLPRGAEFMKVFQFVTTAGLLAHVSAKFPFVFWFRRKIMMDVLDGVVYALVSGLIFAALWPK